MAKPRIIEEEPVMPYKVVEITERLKADDLLQSAIESKVCAVDSETTSDFDNNYDWAQGTRPFMATFAPTLETVYATYDMSIAGQILHALESSRIRQVYQNLKFDFHHFREGANYIPQSTDILIDDTMFGFRLKFPRQRASLKTASQRYVNVSANYYEKRVKEWLAQETAMRAKNSFWYNPTKPNYSDVPKDIMLPYAAHDAYLTLASWYGLGNDGAFEGQTYEQEVKLAQLLVRVEKAGWRVKQDVLQHHLERARVNARDAMAKWQITAPGIDPFSSTQIAHLVYKQMGEPILFTTENDQPSTNEIALSRITINPTLRDNLLDVRHWSKDLGTLENLEEFTCADGHVHGNLKSEAAKTGRFGSEKPNLQNIPVFIKAQPYTHVRDCFGPEDGFEHLLADYAQIEMVTFAEYCGDPNLCQAIIDGIDLHSNTAARMFGISVEEAADKKNKHLRDLGKGMNFTIVYGAGAKKIAGMLKYGGKGAKGAVSQDDVNRILGKQGSHVDLAKFLLDAYYTGFPSVRPFIAKVYKQVQGRRPYPWIKNRFGRIVPVDAGYEYKSLNYLIQGTAADLMKNAMLRAWDACEKYCSENNLEPWIDVQLFMTIHDELIFKVPSGHSEKLAKYIDGPMTRFEEFTKVPIRVTYEKVTSEGSWAEAEEFSIA